MGARRWTLLGRVLISRIRALTAKNTEEFAEFAEKKRSKLGRYSLLHGEGVRCRIGSELCDGTIFLDTMEGQASVPRDVFPPTPPGPEGSNGNGLFRVQWSPGAWLLSLQLHTNRRFLAPLGRTNIVIQRRIGGEHCLAFVFMTKRLYYDQPELLEFDTTVEEVTVVSGDDSGAGARHGIILRDTAFYPTSGGQVHDTGWIALGTGERVQVAEVADLADGRVVHYLEMPVRAVTAGAAIQGHIDAERRRDHTQQHTGQHVLSAAFVELYRFPTVSFHMGEDYCSIDLATESLTAAQVMGAEKRANEIVFENRSVRVRYVKRDEAEKLGLRKLPPEGRDELRLIEVADFDLSACGERM